MTTAQGRRSRSGPAKDRDKEACEQGVSLCRIVSRFLAERGHDVRQEWDTRVE